MRATYCPGSPFGFWNGALVRRPHGRTRVLQGTVVQRHPGVSAPVVSWKSRAQQREPESLEPDISYNFESGWFVLCEPSITYDWTAEARNAWTIPMGVDVGKAFKVGSRDLSLQVGAYDLLRHPDGTAGWIFRASVTFLFRGRTNKH